MATAKATTDHDAIRKWVETRGGHPACVKGTGSDGDPGVLRIDFPGYSGEDTLQEIEWDQFFEWFDRDRLALLLGPGRSRFSKFVKRTGGTRKAASSKKTPSKKTASSAKKATASKKGASTKKAAASKKGTGKKASATKAVSKKAASTKTTSTKTTSKKTAANRGGASSKRARR